MSAVMERRGHVVARVVCALATPRAGCHGGMRSDGQSPHSPVKSRLCLMNRAALPSHWAGFTSSHNHSPCFPTFASARHLHSSPSVPSPSTSSLCFLRHKCLANESCLFSSFIHLPCVVPHLQPLGQEEQPGTLEQARPNLPVQGDYSRHTQCNRLLSQQRLCQKTNLDQLSRSSSDLKPTKIGLAKSRQINAAASWLPPFKQRKTKCLSKQMTADGSGSF